MIDKLGSTDKPVKIKLCVGTTFSTSASTGNQFTTPDISGYQLFYSLDGSKELAGPAHGETQSGCTDHAFPASHPSAVNFYADPTYKKLQGLKLLFTVAGQSTPQSIQAGVVDQSGQLMYEHLYQATDTLQFFGFEVGNGDMDAAIAAIDSAGAF